MRLAAALLIGLMLAGPAAAKTQLAAWVEMTGAGAEMRAVIEGAACPKLTVDGKARAMILRAGPDEAFDNRICEAALPRAATHASRLCPWPRACRGGWRSWATAAAG